MNHTRSGTLYGLRTTGTAGDLASLRCVPDVLGERVAQPWVHLAAPGRVASAVLSPALDIAAAQALRARGVSVVRATEAEDAWQVEPLGRGAEPERWEGARARPAAGLVEALRPVPLPGDPEVEEACFQVPVDGVAARSTLERLLALGRDDVLVAELVEGATRWLFVRAPRPPLYLLMRAREEPGEGVRAYARTGGGGLWVAWGFAHPLAALATRVLAAAGQAAFVDADGTWRRMAAPWPERSVYDVLAPELPARPAELVPAEGSTRFRIRLRLEAAPEVAPELWLLDAEQFLRLEDLIEGLRGEELDRFVVTRTADLSARVGYVLQELVRPNVPRLGTRVSDLTGARGFARAPGVDNLYLPVGRRIMPRMRRDELRLLLGTDRARLVVLDEDADGPRRVSVRAADEVPLARWVEYVATDRRAELERMVEESVFDFPEVQVERAARAERARREAGRAVEARVEAPRRRPEGRARDLARVDANPGAQEDPIEAETAALREEIHRLEQLLVGGGCDAAGTWSALGRAKARVNDAEEACQCMESALFFLPEGADEGLAQALGTLRARQINASGTPEELVGLAVRPRLVPTEASYLGAVVLARLGSAPGELEDVLGNVVRRFADPELPVSRRLAWRVLAEVHRRAGDRLGMTRAKERVLGSINESGLSETFDLPRFVRLALAMEGGPEGGGTMERARSESLAVLEELWQRALVRLVRELDARSAYLRMIFAMGFVRLGAPARARDLVEPVEAELPVHELPNRVIFGLYRDRMAHVATRGAEEAWARVLETTLAAVKDPRARDRVEWLCRRSAWLRAAPPEERAPVLRAPVQRVLLEAEGDPGRLAEAMVAATTVRVRGDGEPYDYEKTAVVERLLGAALRSGNDGVVGEVLAAAEAVLGRIGILGHRARAIGACIRAAAAVGDAARVDRLLDAVIAVAVAPAGPSVRDLLLAVGPGLLALRRLGVLGSARRFLEELVPVARRGGREGTLLRAALADGFLQVREGPRADELLDEALEGALGAALEHDHVGRYEAGAAVLAALRHWPLAQRAPRCGRLLGELERFTDTFTVRRYYDTHRVLLLEGLVDAVADEVTFQSDRVRAWLDAEEQATRRRIVEDWSAACGP